MLDDITLGRYQARNSIIHSLDPRTKGGGVLILMIAVFAVSTFWGLGLGLAISVIILILSRIGLSDMGRNFKAFLWLFILTFALHLLFDTSERKIFLPYIGMYIGIEAVFQGLFYCGRIALILILSYLFMATTAPMEIADGLERSMKPLRKFKLPTQEIALMISIAFRFVPTFIEEAQRIRDAQICRGARIEGHLLERIKSFSAMLIPLFASALRKAELLSLALEARGYRGGAGRSSFVQLRFRISDFGALVFIMISVAVLIAL
jgi:energy-coupling factor transport system permease protein